MTKGTDQFKETIKAHLDQRAIDDALFAESYKKEGKNLDDCVTYILSSVQKSGYNGFAREEIHSMAVHYYDEDDIEVGKLPDNMRVVVDHHIELTQEEIEEARKKAIDTEIEKQRQLTAHQKKSKKDKIVEQQFLFD